MKKLIIGFILGLAVVPVFKFVFDKSLLRQPPPSYFTQNTIKEITYKEQCNVDIGLAFGEHKIIDIADVYDRTCSSVIKPVISPDGKFAAFELWATQYDSPTQGFMSDNSLYVYFVSKDTWARIMPFGAATLSSLSFDKSGNLAFDVKYDQEVSHWQIDLAKIDKHFDSMVNSATHELNVNPQELRNP